MSFLTSLLGNRLGDLERKIIDKDWQSKLDIALEEQRNIYELKLQEKQGEIDTLSGIIDRNKTKIREAEIKEHNAKSIMLKAKEMISEIDNCYTAHAENSGLIMTDLKNIRNKIEIFSQKLLGK